ncbi:hypothetical protein MN608_09883 [Microdochium nivale]|nr:hypothetical protein MN608_09883 [Microdochium nivale]
MRLQTHKKPTAGVLLQAMPPSSHQGHRDCGSAAADAATLDKIWLGSRLEQSSVAGTLPWPPVQMPASPSGQAWTFVVCPPACLPAIHRLAIGHQGSEIGVPLLP